MPSAVQPSAVQPSPSHASPNVGLAKSLACTNGPVGSSGLNRSSLLLGGYHFACQFRWDFPGSSASTISCSAKFWSEMSWLSLEWFAHKPGWLHSATSCLRQKEYHCSVLALLSTVPPSAQNVTGSSRHQRHRGCVVHAFSIRYPPYRKFGLLSS